jgi:hypothetical protein
MPVSQESQAGSIKKLTAADERFAGANQAAAA